MIENFVKVARKTLEDRNGRFKQVMNESKCLTMIHKSIIKKPFQRAGLRMFKLVGTEDADFSLSLQRLESPAHINSVEKLPNKATHSRAVKLKPLRYNRNQHSKTVEPPDIKKTKIAFVEDLFSSKRRSSFRPYSTVRSSAKYISENVF